MIFDQFDNLTLDEIEAEIAVLNRLPLGKRTVRDTERLHALQRAQRRIRGKPSHREFWR